MTNQDKLRAAFEAWSRKWCDGVLNSDDDAGRVSRLGAWAAWQAATAAAVAAERERCARACEDWRAGCDNRTMQAEGWAAAECAAAIRRGE